MSHFSQITTKFKKRSAIVKALKQIGFSDHMIEVSDTPLELRQYGGSIHKSKANIRVKGHGWGHKQNYVGGLATDLGFELQEDGTYAMHCDNAKYKSNWHNKFADEYAKAVVYEHCEEKNFFISEEKVEKDGTIVMKLTSPF